MLKITVALLLLVSSSAFAEDWSTADTKREVVYLALHIVDWGQTRNIARVGVYYEQNPFLGKHPSVGTVNNYFAATALLHVVAAHALPSDWRTAFQYVTIGIQGGVVLHNYSIGIKTSF